MLSTNLQMLLLSILILLVGVALTFAGQYLTRKGKDPTSILVTADTVLTEVQTANEAFGKFLPAPAGSLATLVIKFAQAGVHAAQQLFDSDQLTQEERNQKAFDATINLLKLDGHTPTPELETAIKDMIEAGVFVMQNMGSSTSVVAAATVAAVDQVPGTPTTQVDTTGAPTESVLEAPAAQVNTTEAPTPDAPVVAPKSLQDTIDQGIRQALQATAQQASTSTLQAIADEAIQAGVKQAQAAT